MTIRIVATVCVCVLFMTGVSCSGEKLQSEPVLRPVRAVQVFSTGSQRVRTFSGVAQAGVESKISFKVSGTIQKLNVEVGSAVRKGDLIAVLDPEDYTLQVQDARASLAQAKAQLRNATADYERVRGLYENRNASKQDLDGARAQFESAAANVESVEKRLELSSNQLAYTRLRSPLDGSIASSEVEVNENVQAGQTICMITGDSDIEVEVAIPGILIAQIRESSAVIATFDALPGREFSGTVTEIGVAATEMATTFPVTVRLDKADDEARSGMAAEVAFQFGSVGGRDRYIVPTVAVGEDREGRFVYAVQTSGEAGIGVVARKPVTVGELTGEGLVVFDGISDGEFIVTAGVSKLSDGQRVRFNENEANAQ